MRTPTADSPQGTTFYYQIRAINGVSRPVISNISFAATQDCAASRDADESSRRRHSTTQIKLTWTDIATDNTNYLDRTIDRRLKFSPLTADWRRYDLHR